MDVNLNKNYVSSIESGILFSRNFFHPEIEMSAYYRRCFSAKLTQVKLLRVALNALKEWKFFISCAHHLLRMTAVSDV